MRAKRTVTRRAVDLIGSVSWRFALLLKRVGPGPLAVVFRFRRSGSHIPVIPLIRPIMLRCAFLAIPLITLIELLPLAINSGRGVAPPIAENTILLCMHCVRRGNFP